MSAGLNINIFKSPDELGKAVAGIILQEYKKKGRLVLGVPWGTTPIPVFTAFADAVRERNIDISNLHFVMMDEYVTQSGSGYLYVSEEAPYSGHCHMKAGLLDKLPVKQSLQAKANLHFPEPASPEQFDVYIKSTLGGVDIFLVATGAEDGHVAMCGPGTPLEASTRIVKLPETVRDYNFKKMKEYFGNSISNVPRFGISVGLNTILEARKLLFIAHGSSKARIVERLAKAGMFVKDCPVTFLWNAAGKSGLYLDEQAAARIRSLK
ncbi:6-phosphogluconolactonase [Candidatus Woesearchaeota archaeon]|nr:6-phosphogluconolactonase [Candidatus Woesearchaeota archaeon]